MISTLRNTIAGASAIMLLGLTGALAATVTVIDSSTQGAGNDAGVGYAVGYGANTPTGATWSVDPTWEAPPEGASGISQSPFNNVASLEGTQDYFTIGGVLGSNGAASPVSLSYASVQSTFTLLWVSIDSYNSIEFLRGGVSQLLYTGTDLINQSLFDPLSGAGPNYEQVALVNFSNFANGFDKVTFKSTQAAFEMALPPVPVPAAGLLLLGALGGLAALRRRKTV